jgi:hypothetical protein
MAALDVSQDAALAWIDAACARIAVSTSAR